jgi:glycosyltransferase involved in cell wall biosynthesis
MRKVSIVIPCRNEAAYIGKCLDSIVQCNYDKSDLKVFVCDGLSDDGTEDIIKQYEQQYEFIHYLKNEKQVTPFALNLGLKAASFDFAIILGAHAAIDKDFVKLNQECLQARPEVGCCGGIIDNVHENEEAAIISKAMSSPFGVGNAHFRTGTKSGYVDTVAFGAYRREVFERCGYFDEELVRNQDDEFNYRVLKHGFGIFLEPTIRSQYFVRGNYKKLWRQYEQYGYWKVYVNLKHKAVTTLRQLIPAMMVSGFSFGLLLSIFIPMIWAPLLSLIALYLTSAGYFASKKAEGLKELASIIKCFMILHFSYGSGYLKGILDFIVLRKKPSAQAMRSSR